MSTVVENESKLKQEAEVVDLTNEAIIMRT